MLTKEKYLHFDEETRTEVGQLMISHMDMIDFDPGVGIYANVMYAVGSSNTLDYYFENEYELVHLICENRDKFERGLSQIHIVSYDCENDEVYLILFDRDGNMYAREEANDMFCLKIAQMPEDEHIDGALDCDCYLDNFTDLFDHVYFDDWME